MTEFTRIGRERLPNRRTSLTKLAEYNGRAFHISAGFSADGHILEIFARDAGKHDSDQDRLVDDLAVILSLALQHGIPLEIMISSLGHLHDGAPNSVIGTILDAALELAGEVKVMG